MLPDFRIMMAVPVKRTDEPNNGMNVTGVCFTVCAPRVQSEVPVGRRHREEVPAASYQIIQFPNSQLICTRSQTHSKNRDMFYYVLKLIIT